MSKTPNEVNNEQQIKEVNNTPKTDVSTPKPEEVNITNNTDKPIEVQGAESKTVEPKETVTLQKVDDEWVDVSGTVVNKSYSTMVKVQVKKSLADAYKNRTDRPANFLDPSM